MRHSKFRIGMMLVGALAASAPHAQAPAPSTPPVIFEGCQAADSCPPQNGVAMVIQESSVVGLCNASMIGPSVVVTNEHCVRDFGFKPDDVCGGKIRLFFPQRAGAEIKARELSCAKVRSKSQPGDATASGDYALLSVTETLSEALRVDKSPLKPGESLILRKWSFGSIRMPVHATYAQETCEAILDSLLFPGLGESGSEPDVYLGGCVAIPGNSGSALVNARGEMRAVLWGRVQTLPAHVKDISVRVPADKLPDMNEVRTAPYSVGTPAVCMRYFHEGAPMPADCVLTATERTRRVNARFSELQLKLMSTEADRVLDHYLRVVPRAGAGK